jgi:hypothetical protein
MNIISFTLSQNSQSVTKTFIHDEKLQIMIVFIMLYNKKAHFIASMCTVFVTNDFEAAFKYKIHKSTISITHGKL